jgi:hypothetical protein
MTHERSRTDGALSFGLSGRIMRMNLPLGPGSRFDSLPEPWDAFGINRSIEPSGLALRGQLALAEYRSSGFSMKKRVLEPVAGHARPEAATRDPGIRPIERTPTY